MILLGACFGGFATVHVVSASRSRPGKIDGNE
jgi:hypothetical protein